MRTTITLEPDTTALVQSYMRTRGRTFKQAVNELIRASQVRDSNRPPFQTATAELGLPSVNLDRALALAAELEDEELLRKSRLGK